MNTGDINLAIKAAPLALNLPITAYRLNKWAKRFEIRSVLNRRTLAAVAVPLLLFAVQACNLIRNQVFYQTSPDHKKKLVVGTYGLKPELRIDLEQGLRSRTLLTIMGEWYTGFLQMYWSPDSKICAFWIAANGSINGVLKAFDASIGKEVDPNLVRDNIRKLITDKYKCRTS